MWYLCRKPSNSIVSRTSVFSTSQSGDIEDISFIITNEKAEKTTQSFGNNPWEWYTYECTPMRFIGVAVPRHTQLISVSPDYFLCARMAFSSSNDKSMSEQGKYGKLCTYSRQRNEVVDLPSCMELEEMCITDLFSASCAILGGWFYVAGGYKALSSPAEKPLVPLASAERLNLTTLEWETLPTMIKPQAYATGIAYRGVFYCVGGEKYQHSAQIYHPKEKKWFLSTHFIPEEANGFSAGSVNNQMILLTWSTFLGVKLWRYNGKTSGQIWTLVQFYADTKVARSWLDKNGPKLVRIQNHLFIMTGVDDYFCWVDGLSAWPILPGPSFQVCGDQKLSQSGCIHAIKLNITTNAPSWRSYPVYRIEHAQ